MISYAANRQDVLLDRAFPRMRAGFYIDVGAGDPREGSVTRHFSDLGWRGVNVEPAADPLRRLREDRPRDVNLGVALSAAAAPLTLYEFTGEVSGLSTVSAERAARHRAAGLAGTERTVEAITLAQLCEEHAPHAIDFVSIGVPEHAADIIAGGDWLRWRPRVLVVSVGAVPAGTAPQPWEGDLLERGYLLAAFDGMNQFYVRSEDADLRDVLSVPVNATDDYIPDEFSRRIEELRQALAVSQAQLGALEAVHQALQQEHGALADEVALLRSNYERLDRALTATRARCETLLFEVEARAAAAPDAGDITDLLARADAAEAAFREVGPVGLGVARRLSAISGRHPAAAGAVKQGLRGGVGAARALRRSVGPRKG